jgi:hypothetical protein
LPVTDPTLLLSLQRAAINAQNHGLDMCLNEEELHSLQRMADEVRSDHLTVDLVQIGQDKLRCVVDSLSGSQGIDGMAEPHM